MLLHMAFDFYYLISVSSWKSFYYQLFPVVLEVEVGGSAGGVARVRVRYGGRYADQRKQGRVSKELKASM